MNQFLALWAHLVTWVALWHWFRFFATADADPDAHRYANSALVLSIASVMLFALSWVF